MEKWELNRHDWDADLYYKRRCFNGVTYNLEMYVEENRKSFAICVGLSSGKKRDDLLVFHAKDNKNPSGISPLLWVKNEMLSFAEEFKKTKSEGKKCILYVGWADNRRRRIYERLKNYGFYFGTKDGSKCLIKLI